MKNLPKSPILQAQLEQESDLTPGQAKRALDALAKIVRTELLADREIDIPGVGKIHRVWWERKTTNALAYPGGTRIVAPTWQVHFKADRRLKLHMRRAARERVYSRDVSQLKSLES